MNPKSMLLFAFVIGLVVAGAAPPMSTYDAVVAGMHCEQTSVGSLECDYHVGRSLHFGVVGVGDPDAAITFYSVSFDGDYYASVGVSHGCVIVKPGKTSDLAAGFAFVSPRNGKVYRDWQTCADASVPGGMLGSVEGGIPDIPDYVLYAGVGGVTNPELITSSKVQPTYPKIARKGKVSGQVILQVVVRKDGTVGDIQVMRSPGSKFGFDEAAIAAVKQWRYEPALDKGEPVDVYFTVAVDFVFNRPNPTD